MQDRGLTQSRLLEKSDSAIITNIVKDQIRAIDTLITAAHHSGFNRIEHILPVNFGINNMDKKEAQIMIYSELIDIFTKPENQGGKGFEDVTIDASAVTDTIFSVKWTNGMNPEEIKRRKNIVLSHMIKRK
jgi:hypothetical protein